MKSNEYYTALGKLVYTIAQADGKVQFAESSRIFDLVIAKLGKIDRTTEESNTALKVFNIEKEFHRLRDENLPPEVACQQFIDFVDENKEKFDQKHKETCTRLMQNVAEAHEGISEAEQAFITKIKDHLDSF